MAKMSRPSQNTVCIREGKTNILIVNLCGNGIGVRNPQKNSQKEVFGKSNLTKKVYPLLKCQICLSNSL